MSAHVRRCALDRPVGAPAIRRRLDEAAAASQAAAMRSLTVRAAADRIERTAGCLAMLAGSLPPSSAAIVRGKAALLFADAAVLRGAAPDDS